jgi:F-type H+-transporting ATPase subunit delta
LKSASLQYANALADTALAQGTADAVAKQLADFGRVYGESVELRNFLASPAVDHAAKHAVVDKLVAQLGGGKILRNFLFVVADHQRTQALPEIIEAFWDVLRQRQGIAEAEIHSAVELSAAQKAQFTQAIERLTGMRVETKYSLNPRLLGGAVLRIGDTIYDGSVRNRLNELRARLAAE